MAVPRLQPLRNERELPGGVALGTQVCGEAATAVLA